MSILTRIHAIVFAVALGGCMSGHEEAISSMMKGKLPNEVQAIKCGPVVSGARECTLDFGFGDGGKLAVGVSVADESFPTATFDFGHTPPHRKGILLMTEQVSFHTTLTLAEFHSDDVCAWLDGVSRRAIAAAEITAAPKLKSLREKAAIASSYHSGA